MKQAAATSLAERRVIYRPEPSEPDVNSSEPFALPDLPAPAGNVDWRARAWLEWMRVIGWPGIQERTVSQARNDLRLLTAATSIWQPVAGVRDAIIPRLGRDLPIRIYDPLTGVEPRPLLVWYHGGGFVLGDLVTADPTCRSLANRSGAVVVSVDYRLAPEDGCLAGIDDAHAAFLWAVQNAASLGCDPSMVVVGGESAGATLSALVSLRCRDEGDSMPALQVLVYPCSDCSHELSNRDPAVAQLLTWDIIDWFAGHCFNGLGATDPRISPYFVKDLAGLPPALLITAESDLLCTDGEAYGQRLQNAGVPVEHCRYNGQIHGFFTMDLVFPAARRAQRQVATRLRALSTNGQRQMALRPVSQIVSLQPSAWFGAFMEVMTRTPPVLAAQLAAALLQHKIESRTYENKAHSRRE
jgi:acetyl esterase